MTKKLNIRILVPFFPRPKSLQSIMLETTLNFIIGFQLSLNQSPNGLLFTPKVVFNGDFFWSPKLVAIPVDDFSKA